MHFDTQFYTSRSCINKNVFKKCEIPAPSEEAFARYCMSFFDKWEL